MIRIAVMVSGGGTNLQALLDAEDAGRIPHGKIVLTVGSREDAFALKRAEKAEVKTEVISRKKFASTDAFDQAVLACMKENQIDLIVLAGYLSMVGKPLIEAYPKRILNIHPSLIPSFCGKGFYGLKVHEAALARGVKITGATVHYVNEITDGGEILLQKAVKVLPGDTPEVLQRRVMEEAEWQILPEAVKMVSEQLEKEKNHD
ncbi:MAG: phosphoribosylglycinamide formyltransferase [Stecheria intestinalis]|jgi:phosphoribosylglycinamide formyltransferase-1|nr:phosphoribosylglycinamide formyltransferase [Stecheria intestinalis]